MLSHPAKENVKKLNLNTLQNRKGYLTNKKRNVPTWLSLSIELIKLGFNVYKQKSHSTDTIYLHIVDPYNKKENQYHKIRISNHKPNPIKSLIKPNDYDIRTTSDKGYKRVIEEFRTKRRAIRRKRPERIKVTEAKV